MADAGLRGVGEEITQQGVELKFRHVALREAGMVFTRPSKPLKQIVFGRSFFSQIESPRIRNRPKRERTDDHSFSRNLVSTKVALFSVRVWPSRHAS